VNFDASKRPAVFRAGKSFPRIKASRVGVSRAPSLEGRNNKCKPHSRRLSRPVGNILKFDVPIKDVLAFPPAPIVAPLALEAADSSYTGIDFVAHSFVGGAVQRGAALYSLEVDFGFSPPNATDPAPEVGHEVKLMNFNQDPSAPLSISFQNFARNDTGDQAFIDSNHTAGFNRPTNIRFGPDGCAYVVDYGAVPALGYLQPQTAPGPAAAQPQRDRYMLSASGSFA
jgi:hypothetical protein